MCVYRPVVDGLSDLVEQFLYEMNLIIQSLACMNYLHFDLLQLWGANELTCNIAIDTYTNQLVAAQKKQYINIV